MTFLTIVAVNEDIKGKKIADNNFHNISRLFDVLPNFLFPISETMRNRYLLTWYIQVASRVAE